MWSQARCGFVLTLGAVFGCLGEHSSSGDSGDNDRGEMHSDLETLAPGARGFLTLAVGSLLPQSRLGLILMPADAAEPLCDSYTDEGFATFTSSPSFPANYVVGGGRRVLRIEKWKVFAWLFDSTSYADVRSDSELRSRPGDIVGTSPVFAVPAQPDGAFGGTIDGIDFALDRISPECSQPAN